MSRSSLIGLIASLALAPVASADTRFAGIQPHRGGPLADGQAAQPENSLEAFRNAVRLGADVLELDVKLTSDEVPVLMHDATLDRTTDCSGQVSHKSAGELAACRIDVIGIGDKAQPLPDSTVAVPTMAEVLELARTKRVPVNLEIKNVPTDADFDPTPRFAKTVIAGIEASGIARDEVLVQSFWPPNLDVAKDAGFATSFLTLSQVNEQGIDVARRGGYTVLSPGWPIDEEYMRQAREAGVRLVIPYTLDTEQDIERAFALGAIGVITNDLPLGIRTLYGPACAARRAEARRAAVRFRRARAARRRAQTPRARRRAAARMKSARKALRQARRQRNAACARLDRLR